MDETDKRIISLFKSNARMPFVEVAKKLGVSEGTVRSRVKRLMDRKELQFTIAGGEDLKAIIMIATATGAPTTKVATSIRNLGIKTVYEVSGQFDIVCLIESHAMSTINDTIEKIRRLNDVVDTNSLMVLKED
jgi:DNA-binding Lrp family transcriptional regulator